MIRTLVWKTLRVLLFCLLGLIVLVVLALTEEYFRGKSAWEQYQREAAARGVPFDPRPFIPPHVPDMQNFAMTPLLKPLFEPGGETYAKELSNRLKWTSPKKDAYPPGFGGQYKRADLTKWREYLGEPDLLAALKKFDPALDEISAASRRPFARFPLRYEEGVNLKGVHCPSLMHLSQLYALRALAELEAGQSERALADVETMLRLADSIEQEPLVISQLVRISMDSIGIKVIWEGLETHLWSESQLAVLQSRLEHTDILTSAFRSFHFERANGPASLRKILEPKSFEVIKSMFEGLPKDLLSPPPRWAWECQRFFLKVTQYQELRTIGSFEEAYLLPVIDPAVRQVDASKAKAGMKVLGEIFSPYAFLAKSDASSLLPSFPKFAYTQATLDQACIACALERYRLVHGAFPETLDALVPQTIAKLPHDIINGAPLHYQLTPEGGFLLYSVGWNETDDHGTTAMKNNRQDIQQGDWVWRSSALASGTSTTDH